MTKTLRASRYASQPAPNVEGRAGVDPSLSGRAMVTAEEVSPSPAELGRGKENPHRCGKE